MEGEWVMKGKLPEGFPVLPIYGMPEQKHYQKWAKLAEFLEKSTVPEILRELELTFADVNWHPGSQLSRRALNQILKDKYPEFRVLERLKE